jgi:hypothetical protein
VQELIEDYDVDVDTLLNGDLQIGDDDPVAMHMLLMGIIH